MPKQHVPQWQKDPQEEALPELYRTSPLPLAFDQSEQAWVAYQGGQIACACCGKKNGITFFSLDALVEALAEAGLLEVFCAKEFIFHGHTQAQMEVVPAPQGGSQ